MSTQQASPLQWTDAEAYERFMGRWSRVVGHEFVQWLGLPEGLRWLDVGCGTGAFSQVILDDCAPGELVGVDPSEFQLDEARTRLRSHSVRFQTGDALSLPFGAAAFDVAASGLVLNFVSDPARMVEEMTRVVGRGGCVAAYVWDFSGGGSVTQHIGRALVELGPQQPLASAGAQQSATNTLDGLARLFSGAGLAFVQTRPIEIKVRFENFDEYWTVNTGFSSQNSRELAALAPEGRERVKRRVQKSLAPGDDGAIEYLVRTLAVQGLAPS